MNGFSREGNLKITSYRRCVSEIVLVGQCGEKSESCRLEKPLSPTMNPALPRELTFKDDTKVRRKGDVYEQK